MVHMESSQCIQEPTTDAQAAGKTVTSSGEGTNSGGTKKDQPTPKVKRSFSTSDEIIDVAEFLRRVPIARRTLFNLIKAGRIPCIKIADRLLFDWPALRQAWNREAEIRQQKASTATPSKKSRK